MLPLLVNIGFQVLFHSPPGVLFTFPSRYFSAIGHQVVFSLGGWSPLLPTGFLVSRGTLGLGCAFLASFTGLLPSLVGLSKTIQLTLNDRVYRPATPSVRRLMVWALSRSLATTWEIDVSFSSSGYLDVSVHRVPSSWTMCSSRGTMKLLIVGFPIRTSTDRSLLAAPRGFSQLATSFFGS